MIFQYFEVSRSLRPKRLQLYLERPNHTKACPSIQNCSHINQKINFHYNNKLTSGTFKTINKNGQAVIQNNLKSINYNGVIELL